MVVANCQVEQSPGTILKEDACIIANGSATGYFIVNTGSGIFNYEYTVTADDGSKKLPSLVVLHGAVKMVIASKNL